MRFSPAVLIVFLTLIHQAALGSGSSKSRHWQEPSVTLHVAPGGGVPLKAFRSAVEAAAMSWNRVGTGPELLVDGAVTSARKPALDGVNAVFFVQGEWAWDPSEIALTFAHVHSSTGEIVEVDVALNAVHHRFGEREDEFDIENVIAHELGHALGLPHLEDESEATMFPSIHHGEVKKRDLEHTDESALLSLYEGIDAEGPAHGCSQAAPADTLPLIALALALVIARPSSRRPRRVVR